MTPENDYILGVFAIGMMVHALRPQSDYLTLFFVLAGWFVADWDALKVASIIFIVGLLIDTFKGFSEEPDPQP